MNKFTNILEKVSTPVVAFVDTNKELRAIKDGMIAILPLTLFGSIILIITGFPGLESKFPALSEFLWMFLGKSVTATIGVVGIAVLFIIAYYYSKELEIDPIYGITTAFSSWIMLVATSVTQTVSVGSELVDGAFVDGVISLELLGSVGMISSIIIALLSVRVYSFFEHKNITIKTPDTVPANVAGAFTALIPFFITMGLFNVVYYIFSLTDYATFNDFIYQVISMPLLALSDSPITIVLVVLVQQLLWFFGIHGTMVVMSVFGAIYTQTALANIDAFNAGLELPYLVTGTFIDVYVTAGAGGILAFLIASKMASKSEQYKFATKAGIGPAVFNIQEPVTFGIPLVYNPIFFIPFVLVPTFQALLAYILMLIGFAPVPVLQVPWTTPIIISGLLSTNFNIMGAITQVILLVLGVVIWLPFIKTADNINLKNEQNDKE